MNESRPDERVWVFNGDGGRFAGGVFTSRDRAEAWIADNELDGVLTLYPLDVGIYEWAIASGLFTPKKADHSTPRFIGSFTTASQEHDHYEQGERIT
jgi:hypothetical protein